MDISIPVVEPPAGAIVDPQPSVVGQLEAAVVNALGGAAATPAAAAPVAEPVQPLAPASVQGVVSVSRDVANLATAVVQALSDEQKAEIQDFVAVYKGVTGYVDGIGSSDDLTAAKADLNSAFKRVIRHVLRSGA